MQEHIWWIVLALFGVALVAWLRTEKDERAHELFEALLTGLIVALATYPVTLALRSLEQEAEQDRQKSSYLSSIVGSADLTGFTPDRQLAGDLDEVHLRGKILRYSNFDELRLHSIDASFANFEGAELRRADFKDADLRNVYLRGADLTDATMTNANLVDADLRKVILGGATLEDADIRWTDFRRSYARYPKRLTDRDFAALLRKRLVDLRAEQSELGFCFPEDDPGPAKCGEPARELWEE